jgi:radical SAM protein with 4Fe4S-binding SPASM domain
MNNAYILNPDYILKNDINRVILFSKKKIENKGTLGWLSYIHPVQAMIFSFFTERRTLTENIQRISSFIQKDFDITKEMILPFIENKEALKANWEGQKIYIPANFLVNINTVSNTKELRPITVKSMKCKSPIDISTKRVNSMPLIYTFMLTNKCVTKCKYCYADTDTKIETQLSTERILELIRQSYDIGIQNINLIGGEIFLHKDWDVILVELIKYGYEPDIISTKYPLTKDMINRLEEINFKNPIQVSLDANDKQILCDSLEVRENYLEKIKESIILLDKSNLKYQISSVLTQYNGTNETMRELFTFINTLDRVLDWSLRPAMNSLYKKKFVKIKLHREQIVRLFDFVEKEIVPSSRVKIILDKSLLKKEYYVADKGSKSFKGAKCSALNSHMFVLPDGKVTICEQLYWKPQFIIGNLSNQNISEVWNSYRVNQLINFDKNSIRKESKCSTCQIFESCYNKDKNRCWVDIIKAYGDENWDFPDPRCKKAPVMTSNIGFQ